MDEERSHPDEGLSHGCGELPYPREVDSHPDERPSHGCEGLSHHDEEPCHRDGKLPHRNDRHSRVPMGRTSWRKAALFHAPIAAQKMRDEKNITRCGDMDS